MIKALLRLLLCAGSPAWVLAADLVALPEFRRPDPFGGIVSIDRADAGIIPPSRGAWRISAARAAYVSFHLVVRMPETGEYTLAVELKDPARRVQVDAFREWWHFTVSDRNYYPDALIPVTLPVRARIPDPDNRIEKQTSQAFWIDLWVPPETQPGLYPGIARLQTGKRRFDLPLELKVLPAVVPAEDVVLMDHNSYGSYWLSRFYDGVKVPSDDSLRLNQLYHRLFYEHRGTFHQLGYGHGGKVMPEYAPELTGTGSNKHVAGWDLYDRHYGPLLDGSAFAGTRRGPKPIPFVYLPVNPEWPASFLWWGEPGYEAEFVNVVSEMEEHFRTRNWTGTHFEFFFNHKKRYKAFPWDGDEVRFPEDEGYLREYRRLIEKAIPAASPVQWVLRSDSSWSMERQFKSLAGIVNFWVCGSGIFSWCPYAPSMLKERGDIVWMYGGPPVVRKVSSAITEFPFRTWLYGAQGWVHWLTVDPGEDPWFHFEGGGTGLAYPGARFGIRAPIASVRLKLQRNCVQDLALLDSFKSRIPLDELKREATRRYNGSSPGEWWLSRPAMADTPPQDWTNNSIDEAITAANPQPGNLGPAAWQNVRNYILDLAAEGK